MPIVFAALSVLFPSPVHAVTIEAPVVKSITLDVPEITQVILDPTLLLSTPQQIDAVAVSLGVSTTTARAIAWCESRYTQFNPDGSVLQGAIDPRDTGILQINTMYHGADALRAGHDLGTLRGNLLYGLSLLKSNGTAPWKASKHCWSKLIAHPELIPTE